MIRNVSNETKQKACSLTSDTLTEDGVEVLQTGHDFMLALERDLNLIVTSFLKSEGLEGKHHCQYMTKTDKREKMN